MTTKHSFDSMTLQSQLTHVHRLMSVVLNYCIRSEYLVINNINNSNVNGHRQPQRHQIHKITIRHFFYTLANAITQCLRGWDILMWKKTTIFCIYNEMRNNNNINKIRQQHSPEIMIITFFSFSFNLRNIPPRKNLILRLFIFLSISFR